jgi:hypothetical protein
MPISKLINPVGSHDPGCRDSLQCFYGWMAGPKYDFHSWQFATVRAAPTFHKPSSKIVFAVWMIDPHVRHDIAARHDHRRRRTDRVEWDRCARELLLPGAQRRMNDGEIAEEEAVKTQSDSSHRLHDRGGNVGRLSSHDKCWARGQVCHQLFPKGYCYVRSFEK